MIDEALFEAEDKMEKALEVTKDDLAGIRPVGPPGMFNKVIVDYYGAPSRSSSSRPSRPSRHARCCQPL